MINRDRINRIIGNRETLICSIILAILPVLVCILRTALSGKLIGDVWLGASTWNDEAFYYKQVEGMVKYGIPQGYFGYNESHAQYLTFGAWTPLILLPWAIWGMLFGWNMLSPIICNIVIFSFSLFLFSIVTKINRKQLILICIPLVLFTPITRYLLSCMPEVIIISILIVIVAIYISASKAFKNYKIVVIYLLLVYLIAIRPYLAVFMVLPLLLEIREKRARGVIPVFVIVVAFALYSMLTNKYTSEYFGQIYVSWLDKIGTHGARVVANEIIDTLRDSIINLYYNIKLSFSDCNATGAYFFAYLFVMLGWLIEVIYHVIKKNLEKIYLPILIFIGHALVLLAILIMYNLADGSKHLITFIIVDIFLFSTIIDINVPFIVLQSVLFVVAFFIKTNAMTTIPYINENSNIVISMQNELNEKMMLGEKRWDNTVAYLYDDYDSEGEYYVNEIIYMYGIPTGFGINLCNIDYALVTDIKSRYIVASQNGEMSRTKECDMDVIYEDEKVIIYERK